MTRGKKILTALAALLLLLLAGALTLDSVARSALESVLTRTFGTETTVESLDLEVFAGRVTVEGVRVANPEGFGDAPFLSLRSATLGAGLAHVLRDTVDVRDVGLEGLELDLAQRASGSNFGAIMASVEEARRGDAGRDETAYRIRELVVRDVTARARIGGGALGEAGATVAIPEIRLENVGSGRGGAVTLSELAGLTVQAVLRAVARESGGLPGSLRALLRDGAGTLPGGLEIRLPGGEEGRSLREQAEETLRDLVPGGDDDG